MAFFNKPVNEGPPKAEAKKISTRDLTTRTMGHVRFSL